MCKPFIEEVRHRLNSAHIYCRLSVLTNNKKKLKRIVKLWESTPFYKMLYIGNTRMKRKEVTKPKRGEKR